MLRNLSIKRKLTLVTMITSWAALLVACVLFAVYDHMTFRQTLLAKSRPWPDIVGGNSTAALSFDDKDSASQILGRLRAQRSIRTAALLDPAADTFTSFQRPAGRCRACQGVTGCRVHRRRRSIVTKPIDAGRRTHRHDLRAVRL